jgi:hypothetical protein
VIITSMFFTWAARNLEADRMGIIDVDEHALMVNAPAGEPSPGEEPVPSGRPIGP